MALPNFSPFTLVVYKLLNLKLLKWCIFLSRKFYLLCSLLKDKRQRGSKKLGKKIGIWFNDPLIHLL